MKASYNFLEGGCSFRYRDNFSGLSNETKGAAFYQSASMDSSIHQLVATINTYQRLLHRYASYIVKNKLVASLIIEDVIEIYSTQVTAIPPSEIKRFLRIHTLRRCQQWLDSKSPTLFLRKPKNPT